MPFIDGTVVEVEPDFYLNRDEQSPVLSGTEVDKLDLLIGTLVVDERLGATVNYRWQGRLPTEEELKQMAYLRVY